MSAYILAFLEKHTIILPRLELPEISFLLFKQFIKTIYQINPNINFLSDVIAFEAAVVAIAIPLSLEIISRISERYQSQVLTKKFNQELEVRVLPLILTATIIIAVSLKFFGDSTSGIWKVLAWLVFVGFLSTSVMLFIFSIKLRRYITNTEFSLGKLFGDAEKIFKFEHKSDLDDEKLILIQTQFIQALEGIGDVLTFETKNKKGNKDIIQGLAKTEELIKRFLDIKKNEPDKFERLLLSHEFFDIYKENEQNAQIALFFTPDKYLISFSTAVNQILRIYEAAIETKNDEISRFATYHLTWLLAHISQTPKNDLLAEKLLKNLSDIRRVAIKHQDTSMYSASIDWYTSIVFKRTSSNKNTFDLSYLQLFNRYFFDSFRFIISENQTKIFQYLISFLVDGIHTPISNQESIENYVSLIWRTDFQKYEQLNQDYKIETKVKYLEKLGSYIDTKEKLDLWLEKFDELKVILEPNLKKEQKQKAKQIEEGIKEVAIFKLKYTNLLAIVFAIGAYCLFKNKPDYIRELWEYKQPPDSDASWVGHDIVSSSINDAMNLYFGRIRFDFWEGHHGSEPYYEKYFLLLLARIMQKEEHQIIDSYSLPIYFNTYCLNNIKHSVDSLVKIINKLKEQTRTLKTLRFDVTRLNETIDNKLITFLQSLKPQVEQRIKSIVRKQGTSLKKVEEFKEHLINSFNEMVVMKNICKHYNLYKDETNEELRQDRCFGFSIVFDKAAFFEEWYMDYTNTGTDYGRNIASSEDLYIISNIASHCTEIEAGNLEKIVERFNDLSDVIIIAKNIFVPKAFESKEFKSRWNSDVTPIKITGFEEWYTTNAQNIPVFQRYCANDKEKIILVLDVSRLGKLIQYSPIDEEKIEEFRKGIFHISVQAFSENQKLIEKFLENPNLLDGLVDKGDKAQQREYLEEKVLIKVSERFEFKRHEKFEGYLMKLAD